MTAIKDIPQDTFESDHGTISYGAVRFGVFRHGLEISGLPQYDEAGRVVTHIKYTLIVSTIIYGTDGDDQQSTMETILGELSEEGQKLTISDIGFGESITTNRKTGSRPDILWGTKPRVHRCQPIAGLLAWELFWECEFNISRCAYPNVLRKEAVPASVLAFNYGLTYSTNDEGLVTRVMTGYAEAPAVRGDPTQQDNRDLLFNVERIWDQITVQIPFGFTRPTTQRSINYAKNRIDFAIVDTELQGGALPDGIVKADIDYNFSSVPPGFARWSATLSGTLTVAKGYHPSWAGIKFFSILATKVAALKKTQLQFRSGVLVPVDLTLGHKMFTRTSSFSVRFMLVACLENITEGAGLWDGVPNVNYNNWIKSLNEVGTFGKRGSSELQFDNKNDLLVNLCGGQIPKNLGRDIRTGSEGPIFSVSMFCPNLTPERSYLAYDEKISLAEDQNLVVHQPAATAGLIGAAFGVAMGDLVSASGSLVNVARGLFPVTQVQSPAEHYLIVTGRAVRLKWRPESRQLTTFNGMELEYLRGKEEGTSKRERGVAPSTPATTFFGCPAYVGRWTHLYRIKNYRPSQQWRSFIKADSSPVACNHTTRNYET